jgi:diguanylate cyclase (GGDEF)-like protein
MSAILAYKSNEYDVSQLTDLGLFKGANMMSISSILNQAPIVDLPAGETLHEAGQPVTSLHLLLSGKLDVYLQAADTETEPVDLLEPGSCIGELAMVAGKTSQQTLVAQEDCCLLVLDENTLMGLVNSSHTVARNFLFHLMQSLRVDQAITGSGDDTTDLKDKFKVNSNVDELTGLHNWHWMESMLDRQVMRSATDQVPLSLMLFDIDQFMTFYADFGEDIANQALYTIAQLLVDNVRPTDLYARYEDDKFLVVLPDTDLEGAKVLAARIQNVIKETQISIPGECLLPPLTVSCGLVQMKAFVAADKLLEDVVEAMKRAKESEERLSD